MKQLIETVVTEEHRELEDCASGSFFCGSRAHYSYFAAAKAPGIETVLFACDGGSKYFDHPRVNDLPELHQFFISSP